MQTLNLGSDKNASIVVLVFVLVHAAILLGLPLLPFIDLPNHLAEATIYKYHGEPGNTLSLYYQPTPWYFPNTFHTIFCAVFPSVEVGNKIFHILYIALLGVSVQLVIRQLGGNPWYALFAFLLTYNYNITFGFVGFAFAIPTLLFLFYLILVDLKENRPGLKFTIAVVLILLFTMHAQAALFGLLLFGGITLYSYRNSLREVALRAFTVPIPVVLLIFAWWFSKEEKPEESTFAFLEFYYKEVFFPDFFQRFKIIGYDNFQLLSGTAGSIVGASFFFLILIPVIYFKPWRTIPAGFWTSPNLHYAGFFLFITLGCYFLLPDKLPGQSPLYQRFCTFVILGLIILFSIILKKASSKHLAVMAIASLCIYSGFWFEYLYYFNKENQSFTPEFFKGTNHEARLAGLIYDNKFRGRRIYIHYPNYFLVWNKGITASKIIDYRFGVVTRVAPESVIPFYHEYIGENFDPRPQPQYSDLEYILVRGHALQAEDLDTSRFTLIKSADLWKLYENNVYESNNLKVDNHYSYRLNVDLP
jgi:hypothetical protein